MNNKVNLIKKAKTETLALGYGQSSNHNSESDSEIKYIWSRNPQHLREYTKLIDKYYENELNLKDLYKEINPKDFNSYFYIVLKNEEVISGARLTVSDKLSQGSLPNEKLGFPYSHYFPELNLENNRYCEISRYSMDERYRKMEIHYINAFSSFHNLTKELGVKYMFILGTKGRHRLFGHYAKKHFKLIDLREFNLSHFAEYSSINAGKQYLAVYENEHVKN